MLNSFTHFCLYCLSAVMEGSKHPNMVNIPQTNVFPPYEDVQNLPSLLIDNINRNE